MLIRTQNKKALFDTVSKMVYAIVANEVADEEDEEFPIHICADSLDSDTNKEYSFLLGSYSDQETAFKELDRLEVNLVGSKKAHMEYFVHRMYSDENAKSERKPNIDHGEM